MKKVDSYARQYIGQGDPELEYNKNVEWMKEPSAWIFYPASVAATFGATYLLGAVSVPMALAITNAIHGIFTFFFLHWIKGSPDFYDQGTFNGLTLWEQIDGGEPFTFTKKYLTLVPTVLLLLTLVYSDYEPAYLAWNMPIWLFIIFPKVPMMHRVRILGINSTPGIDDDKKTE